ncbi:MAG: hypothetical protein WAM05_14420, partial [Candidatus Binataceae bacterium]
MRGGKKFGTDASAATLAIVAALSMALLGARAAHSATSPAALNSATITQNAAVSELRFGFIGVAPKWKLSAHGQELWIDLPHTSTQVPPRPVFGREVQPITAVRVLDAG